MIRDYHIKNKQYCSDNLYKLKDFITPDLPLIRDIDVSYKVKLKLATSTRF